jgi:hypothetical protein
MLALALRALRFGSGSLIFGGLICVWLAAVFLVLISGLRAGGHAGGEVAMQMYLLTLPSSVITGMVLNQISYLHGSAPDSLHVLKVWVPFFLVGGLQIIALASLVRLSK